MLLLGVQALIFPLIIIKGWSTDVYSHFIIVVTNHQPLVMFTPIVIIRVQAVLIVHTPNHY